MENPIKRTRKRRKLGYDPDSFDWSKSTAELAVEHNISPQTVQSWRRKLAPRNRKKPSRNVDPKTFDWSMSTRELATKHDVSIGYIWLHRRRLAPHTIPKNGNAAVVDWGNVDWHQTNVQLMRALRCGYQTIAKKRAIHAPDTAKPNVMERIKLEAQIKRMENHRENSPWTKMDWSLSNAEIIRRTGATKCTVTYMRNIHAPETVKRRNKLPDLNTVDWSLSDTEIAMKYNVALITAQRGRIAHGKLARSNHSKK